MAVRAVIFDCFGVLIEDAYMTIRKKYSEAAEEVVELNRQSSLGEITSEEKKGYVEKLLDDMGMDGRVAVAEAVGGIQRNGELIAEIEKLRGKVKVGLLSNVGEGFWKRFSEEEVNKLFDDVVLSYQVGLAKPDGRIFELAVERLGVEVGECVFFDDDEGNVRAAEAVGMKGVVYEWGMDLEKCLRRMGI